MARAESSCWGLEEGREGDGAWTPAFCPVATAETLKWFRKSSATNIFAAEKDLSGEVIVQRPD